MPWSGRDVILAEFLPRFRDRQLAVESLNAYIRGSRVLDDDRARQWLERDLARDKELAAIADPEDYVVGPSSYGLRDCHHCYGRGFVAAGLRPLPSDPAYAQALFHPEFGKAKPCPACSGSATPGRHCPKCAAFAKGLANGTIDPATGKPYEPVLPPLQKRDTSRDYVRELARHMTPPPKPPRGYELAQAQGFEGTLEEWAAIVSGKAEPQAPPPVQEPLPEKPEKEPVDA